MPDTSNNQVVVEHYTDQDLEDMLPIYYKRLFPHEQFYRWLSYGHSEYIRIITTKEYGDKIDVVCFMCYSRSQCFHTS